MRAIFSFESNLGSQMNFIDWYVLIFGIFKKVRVRELVKGNITMSDLESE